MKELNKYLNNENQKGWFLSKYACTLKVRERSEFLTVLIILDIIQKSVKMYTSTGGPKMRVCVKRVLGRKGDPSCSVVELIAAPFILLKVWNVDSAKNRSLRSSCFIYPSHEVCSVASVTSLTVRDSLFTSWASGWGEKYVRLSVRNLKR